jgi:hypothetical protein
MILLIINLKFQTLDSNEFLSKSLRHYIAETFLALHSSKSAKNPFFEVISLHCSTGPL